MNKLYSAIAAFVMLAASIPAHSQQVVGGRVGGGPNGRPQALNVDDNGNLALQPAAAPTGTAGAPNAAVTTVQGIAGGTPLPTADIDAAAVTTTSAAASGANLLSVDTSGYGGVAVQLTGTWAGTVTFQASDDNVTFYAVQVMNSASAGTGTAVTSNGLFYFSAQHRYARVNFTSRTSGTLTGSAYLRKITTDPTQASTTTVLGAGTSTIGYAYLNIGAATGVGAYTNFRLVSAATTNATIVKASAARIISGQVCNTAAAMRYVKWFNKSTAPVPGTDTPITWTAVPAGQCVYLAETFSVYGIYFATGLGLAVVVNPADTDATAVAAGDVVLALNYF